jgi:hypothetical protein
MLCLSPAIANALDDAVAVGLTELPLNPERSFGAIKLRLEGLWRTVDIAAARITFKLHRAQVSADVCRCAGAS